MPTFTRGNATVAGASNLMTPTGLADAGHSGVFQLRAITQCGWSWREDYGLLKVTRADDMAVIAQVHQGWQRMTIYDVTHPLWPGSGRPPNGLGTGGVTVDGASQSGTTLNVTGFPVSTANVVRAGDVFTVAGDTTVYMIVADGSSDVNGDVALSIIPALRASPANLAAVTLTGVVFKAFIFDRSQYDGNVNPDYFSGMTVHWMEALS